MSNCRDCNGTGWIPIIGNYKQPCKECIKETITGFMDKFLETLNAHTNAIGSVTIATEELREKLCEIEPNLST